MLLLSWLINALALILVSNFVPGFEVNGIFAALVAAFILGLVNAVIRPILILLTLPINLLTLGLFTLVINALMLELVASIVKGFTIETFWAALWGAIVLALISWATNYFLKSSNSEQ
ncbi:MAG: phage holin family protein [bacterium]